MAETDCSEFAQWHHARRRREALQGSEMVNRVATIGGSMRNTSYSTLERIETRLGRPQIDPGVVFKCGCGCEATLVRCEGCGADWALPEGDILVCPLCESTTQVIEATPAQKVIAKAWERLEAEKAWYARSSDNELYSVIDYAVARELGLSVEAVNDALVMTGKREPIRWVHRAGGDRAQGTGQHQT